MRFFGRWVLYCGVDQRLSHKAHNLGIVGSSPTLRNHIGK